MTIRDIIIHDDETHYLLLDFPKNNPDFYEFIYDLELNIKNKLIENSFEWFGTNFNRIKLYNMFKSSIMPSDKLFNVPKLKLKISSQSASSSDINHGVIYNNLEEIIEIHDLKKGHEITIILQIGSINLCEEEIYTDMEIYQIKLCSNIYKSENYLFSEDSDELNDIMYTNYFDNLKSTESEQESSELDDPYITK